MKKNTWSSLLLALAVYAGVWAAPVRAATAVDLRIEGRGDTYFADTIAAGDCSVNDTKGVTHEFSGRAICALAAAAETAGLTYTFEDFGFGLFLKAIANEATPPDFSTGWNFFVNYDPASTGLDGHTVADDEAILLAFSPWPGVPLRVTSSTASAVPGEDVVLTVEKRVGEYDEAYVWHGRWEVAEGASLIVSDTLHDVPADGRIVVTAGETVLKAQAKGDGYIRSAVVEVTVRTPSQSPSPLPSPSPSLSPTPTPIPVPTPTAAPTTIPAPQQAAARALNYLRSRQDVDGTIDGAITSAWSAMAFGAWEERAENIRRDQHSLLDGLALASLSSATDIERQILALRASGVNPRRSLDQDLVALLLTHVREGQIGDPGLLNDDVFGILALLAGGEPAESEAVRSAVAFLISRQAEDGHWESLDMTAAAIQALRAYENAGGLIEERAALSRARAYLKRSQDRFGGWGENSASTAWGIQAVHALGEDLDSWRIGSGATPMTALLAYQNAGGWFGWKGSDDVSAFMTAYAALALKGVPLPVTLLAGKSPAIGGSSVPTQQPAILGATSRTQEAAKVPELESTSITSTDDQKQIKLDVADPTPEVTLAAVPPVPVRPADWRFILISFGLANAGVGVAVARLVSRFFLV